MSNFEGLNIPVVNPDHLVPTPSHVPADRVRPYPFILGTTSKLKPQSFIPPIHNEPALFWAERTMNGVSGAWVPRTHALLQQIYSDSENFKNKGNAPFAKLLGESWYSVPSEADAPIHGMYRTMLNPIFTPKRMTALEEKIRRYAREYILAFKDRNHCEFMADFAFEFPIKVFLELAGLPLERTAQFLAWEHKLLHEPNLDEITKATRAVCDYLMGEIEDRKANPRDDLISYGVQVDRDGRKLNDDELLGFCFNLFIGGLDTVSTHMAWQFHHLAENPAQQAALRADPSLIPAAMEEMMRFYASVAINRECVNEVEIDGVKMMPGDMVQLPTYLAGHDPEAYGDPEVIRFDRNPRHISFGFGPHLCIGMHLARREMRIAMEEFLAEIPEFRLAPDADITYYLAAIMQPVNLPLVWDKR